MADKRIEDFDTLTTLTANLLMLVADTENDETYNATLSTLAGYILSVFPAAENIVNWENLTVAVQQKINSKINIDTTTFGTNTVTTLADFKTANLTTNTLYHIKYDQNFFYSGSSERIGYAIPLTSTIRLMFTANDGFFYITFSNNTWSDVKSSISTQSIKDAAVTTEKLNNGAVTLEKLAPTVYENTPRAGSSKLLTSSGAYDKLIEKLYWSSNTSILQTEASLDSAAFKYVGKMYYIRLASNVLFSGQEAGLGVYMWVINETQYFFTENGEVYYRTYTNSSWSDFKNIFVNVSSSTPTQNSEKLLTSGGAYTALGGKIDIDTNTFGITQATSLSDFKNENMTTNVVYRLKYAENFFYSGSDERVGYAIQLATTIRLMVTANDGFFYITKSGDIWSNVKASVSTQSIKNGAVTIEKISDYAFDNEPMENSTNLVNSGNIFSFVSDELENYVEKETTSGLWTKQALDSTSLENNILYICSFDDDFLYSGSPERDGYLIQRNSNTRIIFTANDGWFYCTLNNTTGLWSEIKPLIGENSIKNSAVSWDKLASAVQTRIITLESTVGSVDSALQAIIDGGVSNE